MNENFWRIYQSLIEPIPKQLEIKGFVQNQKWSAIDSDCGAGVALCFQPLSGEHQRELAGKPLKEIASWIFSWDFSKASVGMAAINAFWNQRNTIEKCFDSKLEELAPSISIEEYLKKEYAGKKVLFVGYFPFADSLKSDCEVTILERRELPGTLPDTACEALIPENNAIIISASTLVNKTYIRLAQLCRSKFSIITGPSSPLSPDLKEDGISQVSGIVIKDRRALFKLIGQGASREILKPDISWKIDLKF